MGTGIKYKNIYTYKKYKNLNPLSSYRGYALHSIGNTAIHIIYAGHEIHRSDPQQALNKYYEI